MAQTESLNSHLPATAGVRAGREEFGAFLLLLFFVGLHTQMTLHPIPFLFAGLVATAILLTYLDRIPLDILRWCGVFLAIAFASILLAPNPIHDFGSRIGSFIYLGVSLYSVATAFILMRQLRRETVANVLLICVVVISVGQIVELAVPEVRHLSDQLGAYLRPASPYDALLRDSQMTSVLNLPRPKFFTPEPSNLAKSISFFIILWYAYSTNKNKLPIAILATVFSIVIGRSPSMIFALVGLSSLIFVQYLTALRRRGVRTNVLVTRLATVFVGLLIAVGFMLFLYQDRLKMALAGEDTSALERFVLPMFISYQVLREHALFGVGVGGTRTLGNILYDSLVYFHFAALKGLINSDTLRAAIGSSFFEVLVSYGLVGTAALMIALNRMRKSISSVSWIFYFPTVLAFWVLHGGFSSVTIWATTILFLMPGLEDASGATPETSRAIRPRTTDEVSAP